MAENSEETAKRETWGRPFQPGQSGNPGGRPKVIAEVRDLARQHTALAIETLVHTMEHGDKDAARVTAAQALLDRGWGKPVQGLDVTGPEGPQLRIFIQRDSPAFEKAVKRDPENRG
jgi:uncharacterized protein DUF5681